MTFTAAKLITRAAVPWWADGVGIPPSPTALPPSSPFVFVPLVGRGWPRSLLVMLAALVPARCLSRLGPRRDHGPAGALPPLDPPPAGFVSFALRQVEMIPEVLAGEVTQLLRRREPDLRRSVRQALEQPLHAVACAPSLPPATPAPAA